MQCELQTEVTRVEMTKTKKELKKPQIKPVKKAYARPRLIEYGNVAKLTASGGTFGFDGMTPQFHMG